MNKYKSISSVTFAPTARRALTHSRPIPNVGVKISKANQSVLIQDRDRVHQDIVMQGKEMQQFIQELKDVSRAMPDVSIRDALAVVTAPYVAGKWC